MKGKGYVEFIANIDEIKDLADRGYSITAIHENLYNEKKITVLYKQFWKLCKIFEIKPKRIDSSRILNLIMEGKQKKEESSKKKSGKKNLSTGKLEFDNNPNNQDRHF